MKMTIGKRIIFGFTAILFITGSLGALAYSRLSTIRFIADDLTDNWIPGVDTLGQVRTEVMKSRGIMMGHLIADTKEEMARLDAAFSAKLDETHKMLADYQTLVSDPREKPMYAAVLADEEAYQAAAKPVLALCVELKTKEAIQLYRKTVAPAFDKYVADLSTEFDLNKQGCDDDARQTKATVNSGITWVIVGLSSALGAGLLIATLIIRGTNKVLNRIAASLGEGSAQVASASSQVSSSSQTLAQGASEQAASLEETSSALEEISSMTRKNADTAQQANNLSAEAQNAAAKGNDAMNKMAAAIHEIEKSANETAKIIKVIDEIAFQTNLLALNAAVEAARAGEAGKGFAVVDEEVRNLAMRSAEAAKNTTALIEGSVNNAKNGVAFSVDVATILQEITGFSTKVNTLVSEIAAASKEQTQGIQQVSTAVSEMDRVTQSNSAGAEESAAASEELSSQAEQMRTMVDELLALVGAAAVKSQHTPSAAAPRQHSQSSKSPHTNTPTPNNPTSHAGRQRNTHAAQLIPLGQDEASTSAATFGEFNSGD